MTTIDYVALGHTSGYLAAVEDGASDVVWVPIKIPDEHQAAYLEGLEAAREAARKEEEGDGP